AHQLSVKQTPGYRAEASQRAFQQSPVFDRIEPATRPRRVRQRYQQRPDMSAACNLPTGLVEQPSDQAAKRARWQEALVGEPAHQDQQLGLDQCQLAIEM